MLKSFKTNQPIFQFHVWTNDDSSKTPHPSIAPFSFGEALARVSHFGGAQVFSWGDS